MLVNWKRGTGVEMKRDSRGNREFVKTKAHKLFSRQREANWIMRADDRRIWDAATCG
jgi:hypothetical protein